MTYRADMPVEEQERRRKAARRKWYEKNKAAILARQSAYQKALDPEKKKAIHQRYRIKHRERERLRAREKNWKVAGLPVATRPEPSVCECCGRPDRKALSLDHCHVTGAFRGWLCTKCNLGIGKLGDTIEALSRALAYLKRAQS